ncbi:RluA family pseudouridine synthase [uncultured Treponema sp.]|uniref:RluA family pseudouridine synthase n=1 Tax=uncultured Treponema sp. TaxID=162155 RepID=UPI0015B91E55|nr:RluA family pseudouridine synthase [uncultured Treponema sp.]
MKTYKILCEKKTRLDELLRRKLPVLLNAEISNSKIRRLITAGGINVNQRQIFVPSFVVFAGSAVTAFIDEEKLFYEKQPDDIKFELSPKDVLFEDQYIIIVNKPSRFPTEKSVVESRDNLHDAVVRYLFEKQKIESPNAKNPPYCGIMHRLDRDTSGAVLFTKKREVNAACHDLFEKHLAKKTYVAAVSKLPGQKKFSVSFTMGRISPKGQQAKWGRLSESRGGLESATEFEFFRESRGFFLFYCRLFTGRTHQIRVHLSDCGCPILGDGLYGGKPFSRMMLHALSLSFVHPVTKKLIQVTAPLPKEFLEGQENKNART